MRGLQEEPERSVFQSYQKAPVMLACKEGLGSLVLLLMLSQQKNRIILQGSKDCLLSETKQVNKQTHPHTKGELIKIKSYLNKHAN